MKANGGKWTLVIYSKHNIVFHIVDAYMVFSHEIYADRPLENLSGGGGGRASEVQKNVFVQGEIKWKKFMHARPFQILLRKS